MIVGFEHGDRVRVSRGDVVLEGEATLLGNTWIAVDVGGGAELHVDLDLDVHVDWKVEKIAPPLTFKPFAVVEFVRLSIDDAWDERFAVRLDDGACWVTGDGEYWGDDGAVAVLIEAGGAKLAFEGVAL